MILNKQMENQTNSRISVIDRHFSSTTVKDGKQYLRKKRPSTTKLDLQKIFEESIQLTQVFKKLSAQNSQLRQQYQKVQSTKSSRQGMISLVEQMVKQKAKQLNRNPTNQSSWLVHKLNSKVYELKNKIQAKQKAIRQVQMSKQSQWIRQKECQLECLDQVLSHMRSLNGMEQPQKELKGVRKGDQSFEEKNITSSALNEIKEMVWLQGEIRSKQEQILQAQRLYEDEQRQVRKTMKQISKSKTELKQIKSLQGQFHRAHEQFKEEKKKKQQRLAGNKTYLDELIQARHNQLNKLQLLRQKYTIIEKQEANNIRQLEIQYNSTKKQYQQKNKARQELVFRAIEEPVSSSKQRWVKRVTFNEVKNIAKNLNHFIALKRVAKEHILKSIFKDQDEQLSIGQVIEILERFPFDISNYGERQLLARYCIQDAGQGYFMQDMQTSEAVPIIKSVLLKLIGDVRIYSPEQQAHLMRRTGELMHKFHSLVQQNIQTKEGNVKKVPKQHMEQGIIATELELDHDHINFIILYLFSWSHNIDQLQISILGQMLEKGVRWILRQEESTRRGEETTLQNQYVEQFE